MSGDVWEMYVTTFYEGPRSHKSTTSSNLSQCKMIRRAEGKGKIYK